MAFIFAVPTPTGPRNFSFEPGTTLFFVGANGGGKTRLAVKIEGEFGMTAHRIAAHRALSLDPSVPKISEKSALHGLRTGHAVENSGLQFRIGNRWHSNAAVSLLNDYTFLVQALFAEQANTSLATHKSVRAGREGPASPTKFEQIVEIWNRVLPHRKLHITGDDIQASITGTAEMYRATDLSDGERAIFYLIGQVLTSAPDSLLIFDEPELHIHRSVMSQLWDELEAARADCGMIVISHDLEFVGSREGQKYVLREYNPATGWMIESVPEEVGFTEEITTLILGSRKPVLFVEGQGGSLDQAIYRACYPDWTIIPRGSCEEVIHSVVTMRANAALTRITCAGIVDADAYNAEERQLLQNKGVAILPVSEIENLFLLPDVVRAIAESEGYAGETLNAKIDSIFEEFMAIAREPNNQRPVVMRYCRRRIDRTLKKIDLSDTADVAALAESYTAKTNELNVTLLATMAIDSMNKSIEERNVSELLKWYDNKGVLSLACKAKGTTANQFEQWIVRALRNGTSPAVSTAIRQALPTVLAR